jgi:predicted alpha/beta hydrolase family esterase
MKKVVIIHCWGGYPNYCWYPQTKKELEALGFEVVIPEMPNTDNPQLTEWLPTLQQIAGNPTEDLYLIGHSLGCGTIMRYLETLKPDEKIGGVVFVAGFTDDLHFKELTNFFTTPLDFKKIKSKAKKFSIIASDNDPFVDLKFAKILKKHFNGDVIIKHNMGHFSGEVDNKKSCTSLPEVTESIIKMSK